METLAKALFVLCLMTPVWLFSWKFCSRARRTQYGVVVALWRIRGNVA